MYLEGGVYVKDRNSGYVGNRMSKNAYVAHREGQFPISKLTVQMLRDSGFTYSVAFFKWLCDKGYNRPIAFHHTGVGYKMTAFYSADTISYVVKKFNLPLLYKIYSGKFTEADAIKQLGIKYVKAKIPASLLNIKSTAVITIDAVSYQGYYFVSLRTWVFPNENQIEIKREWESEPGIEQWHNKNTEAIIGRLIKLKRLDVR